MIQRRSSFSSSFSLRNRRPAAGLGLGLAAAILAAWGCSDATPIPSATTGGTASATGGTSTGGTVTTGGTPATGGTAPSTGGTPSTGGSVSTTPPACVSSIVTGKCTVCHFMGAPSAFASLDMSGDFVPRLLDKNATFGGTTDMSGCPAGAKLIDSATPENSWLLKKVTGAHGSCGTPMPQTGALSDDEKNCMRGWIQTFKGGSSGAPGTGGTSSGGASNTGGTSSGGASNTGGTSSGGASNTGGTSSGGASNTGGAAGAGGSAGTGTTGGATGMGGSGGGGGGGGGTGGTAAGKTAVAMLMPTSGNQITGTATFTQSGEAVTLVIRVSNCPAGSHASHIHLSKNCGNNGNDAGGHWVPQGEVIPDIACAADGTGTATVTPPNGTWTIGGGNADITTHALMVHTGSMADPGGRIACGLINAQ